MAKIETIATKQIMALLEEQGYRCALTGWELTPQTASLDHRIPLGKGGDHCIENAQIIDHRVNAAKGTMTNEDFVAMCQAVSQHNEARHDDACDTMALLGGGSGPL